MKPPGPLASCRAAIGFLTVLPVGPRAAGAGPEGAALAGAGAWFPAVGLLLGAILAALDAALRALQAPPLLSAGLLLTALVVLTRALHLDGFMDTCDALFGGFDRERRLAILRDPHAGAFAVAGAVCLLLVKYAALAALPAASRGGVLLLFPCLSRAAMLLVMAAFPYLRRAGLGIAFAGGGGRLRLWAALLGALAAAAALSGPLGVALAAAAGAVGWAVGARAHRLLGGVTGDVYGAVNETAEAAVLVLAVIVTAGAADALRSPLPLLLGYPQ